MFIATNRFRVAHGFEAVFESMWRERDSYLDGVPGFHEFRLLKGPRNDDEGYTLYASQTLWASRQAFDDWLKSEAFRRAHAQARAPAGTYQGPPVFEGFETVLHPDAPDSGQDPSSPRGRSPQSATGPGAGGAGRTS